MTSRMTKRAIAICGIAILSLCTALEARLVKIGETDKTTKPGYAIFTFSNTVNGVVSVRTNSMANVVARGNRARSLAAKRGNDYTRRNSSILTKEQEKFYKTYTKQVAQELITITNVQYIVATWRKGNEMWQTTNQVKVIQGKQQTDKLGNVEKRVEKLESIFPVHYSKLKLITNLKAVGKWTAVKEQLENADCMDEWNASMFILDTHPLFISATNNAVEKGVCTIEQIKSLLEKSIDE